MRQRLLRNTLTLLGTTIVGSLSWADTPVKPSQSSFSSPSSSIPNNPALKPVAAVEQLLPRNKLPEVETENKVVVDYSIKAASIEVAWLQDSLTYPLHLRAEQQAGQSVILLTGYVPNDRIREKAVNLAKMTVGSIAIVDQLVVQPQMALNFGMPIEPNQAYLVQDMLDKAAPGIGKSLQVSVEATGMTTVSGRVDEFADRLKIIHALQGIPGCTAIRYDLKVYMAATPAVSPAFAAAPVVVPVVPVKTAPATPTQTPKPETVAVDFKPIDTTVPMTATPDFPKLIGPLSTAKQPSPSIEEIERHASRAASPVKTIVQTGHQQEPTVPAQNAALAATAAGTVDGANLNDSHASNKLIHSSLSGLLPPTMTGRAIEPGIQLGSPIIVRTSFVSDSASQQSVVVKSNELTLSSTSTVPAKVQAQEPTPVLINIMPRLAK